MRPGRHAAADPAGYAAVAAAAAYAAAPEAEAELPEHSDALEYAANHPDRREARVAVAVLRNGSRVTAVRFRGPAQPEDELLVGDDLAPILSEALLATLS